MILLFHFRSIIKIIMSLHDGFRINHQELFKDQDIEHVKILVIELMQAVDTESRRLRAKEQDYINRIRQLQKSQAQLSSVLADLDQRYKQTSKELHDQRQSRKQDQVNFEAKIKKLITQRSSPIYFSPKTEAEHRYAVRIDQYSPSRMSPYRQSKKGYNRYQTPVTELLDIRHTTPTKDQIHRLNSYLIENTTTMKLLIEKHNYLLKLRDMGEKNFNEETQLLAKTKKTLNDRKQAEEARDLVRHSRNKYFEENQSDVEKEPISWQGHE